MVRRWNCVHTLAKMLSPATEAFRYFVLERGEGFLATQFVRHWNPEAALVPAQPASGGLMSGNSSQALDLGQIGLLIGQDGRRQLLNL